MNQPHQAAGLLAKPKPTTEAAPWVAVSGGKGGVGKTLLAVNLAVLAARSGRRVLLADLDPGLANVDVHLRLRCRWSIEDLATQACSPAEALTPGPGGITVLAGISGSTRLAHDPGAVSAALAAVRRAAAGFDLVVCDTGAGLGPAVLQTLQHSQLVLAVTTPDPAALTDAYALTKAMVREGLVAPTLVPNRIRDREAALRLATRLSTVAERFLGVKLPLLGWLHEEPDLTASVVAQRPFVLGGRGRGLQDLNGLAAAMLSAFPCRPRPERAMLASTLRPETARDSAGAGARR